jgi:hypothetical protein
VADGDFVDRQFEAAKVASALALAQAKRTTSGSRRTTVRTMSRASLRGQAAGSSDAVASASISGPGDERAVGSNVGLQAHRALDAVAAQSRAVAALPGLGWPYRSRCR